jgi:hypothetical protein
VWITRALETVAPHGVGYGSSLDYPEGAAVSDRFSWSDLTVGESDKCDTTGAEQICSYPMHAQIVAKIWVTSTRAKPTAHPYTMECDWAGRYKVLAGGALEVYGWDDAQCSEVPGTHVVPPWGDDRVTPKRRFDHLHDEDVAIEGGWLTRSGKQVVRGFVDTAPLYSDPIAPLRGVFWDSSNRIIATVSVIPELGSILMDFSFGWNHVRFNSPPGTTLALILRGMVDEGVLQDGTFSRAALVAWANARKVPIGDWNVVGTTRWVKVFNPLPKTMWVYAGQPAKSTREGKGGTAFVSSGKHVSLDLHKGEVVCLLGGTELLDCVDAKDNTTLVISSTETRWQ